MEENTSIGNLLRNAREKSKISLEDMSHKTKINLNILKALEEDDISALPNLAYVRGFVKSIARVLKIDQVKANEALNATYHIKDQKVVKEVKQVELNQSDDEKRQEELQESLISIAQSFFNKNILIGAAILIIVIVIINAIVNWFADLNFERQEISQVNKPQVEDVVEPKVELKSEDKNILEMEAAKKFAKEVTEEINEEEKNSEVEKIEEPKVVEVKAEETKIEPKVAPVKKEEVKVVEVKEEEETKNEEASSETNKEKPKPANGLFPFEKFYPAPLEMFTVEAEAQSEVTDEYLPPNIKAAHQDGSESVYLVADGGDTWISYQTDGGDIKRYVLKKDKRLFLKGKEILIFLGNYRATKIFYNNELITVKSTRSGVKSLIFPPTAAKDHILPLFPVYQGKSYSAKEYQANMEEKPQD